MLWWGAVIDFSSFADAFPRADSCIFRFGVNAYPFDFEQALFIPFTIIIQQEIEREFILPLASATLCWLGMNTEYIPKFTRRCSNHNRRRSYQLMQLVAILATNLAEAQGAHSRC
jgi:hypothetical protein